MSLLARLLLDLGSVKQRSDDRRGSDSDRDSGLHQLVATLLVGAVRIVVAVRHERFSMAFRVDWEAA